MNKENRSIVTSEDKQEVAEKNTKIKKISCEDAERYYPNTDIGLSSSQVAARVNQGLNNKTDDKSSKTLKQIIIGNVFTYFNIIFIIISLFLVSVGSFGELTFIFVPVINTVIGIFQELKAKKTLEKLTLLTAPVTSVIRNGREESISSDELVLDDIVIFKAGDYISADATVCDGELNVNESLVTGESDEIKKRKDDSLLSGSFVISGKCRARLEKVGNEAFAAKISADAKKIKKKQQPGMMKSLTLLIKIIVIIIVPLSVMLFLNQYNHLGLPVKDSIEKTAGSVIGMIPDGLYLLTTIALTVSVMRLTKKNTLVHDMKCIETLARVDVICVDKTGTITEPQMNVNEIIALGDDDGQASRQVRDFVLNMNSDNATMSALKEFFKDKKEFRRAQSVKGFSSATKYSAAKIDNVTYLLGAPEFIMRDEYGSIEETVSEYSSYGERVLLFAEYRSRGGNGNIFEGGQLDGIVIPLALVTLVNRIRPEARETFEYFAEQGVAIKVISGDNPITVSKAAELAGIQGADKYVDATALDTNDKIKKAVLAYNVFGRVTPEQKRQIIRALKKAKHTVAMTGDGVNDVLALKDADCSIAMASGSDAASNVADLVLLDSNFASMPSVVAEGRRVINNIQRSASLYLLKNIFSFVLTIIVLIVGLEFPIVSSQLLLVSSLMIGIPSFILALEPNNDRINGKFLRNVLFKAFPAALSAVIVVGWSLLFASAFALPTEQSSTVAFFLYSFVAYLMLFRVCRPMNLIHRIMVILMGVLYVLAVILIPSFFGVYALKYGPILIMIALMLLAYPIDKAIHNVFENFGAWVRKVRDYLARDIEKHKNDK